MAVTLFESQYFATDHLGSVRVRTDWSGITIHGRQNYYPFGDEWTPALPSDESARFAFNGKERQTVGDLQDLDYGARMKPIGIPRWRTIDPMAENYYSVSPYSYTLNNPIKYIDPDGQDIYELDEYGNLLKITRDSEIDLVCILGNDGVWSAVSDVYAAGSINMKSVDVGNGNTYDIYQIRGDNDGTSLFNFLADNITGVTGVEFSHAMTGEAGDKGLNFISTSHMVGKDASMPLLLNAQLLHGYTIRELNHSHPNSDLGYFPSGVIGKQKGTGDIGYATSITDYLGSKGQNVPNFNIYWTRTKEMIPFNSKSKYEDFLQYKK